MSLHHLQVLLLCGFALFSVFYYWLYETKSCSVEISSNGLIFVQNFLNTDQVLKNMK